MADDRQSPAAWAAEVAARWQALAEELRRRLGLGSPLEPVARGAFEVRFGRDLSGVMLHRGPVAGQLAQALGAEALATGAHVVGAAARLEPTTSRGAALLGHELTHVMQQTGPPLLGSPSDAAIQRAAAGEEQGNEEAAAQAVERALLEEPGARRAARSRAVDAEALAERVYRRMVDELLVERERSGWLG